MIKILAIGNSFSQDSTTYLHDIAAADNIDSKIVNLFIGGCSLKTHIENIENNNAFYQYQLNGIETDKSISIKEALLEEPWDVVTMQQSSPDCGLSETYFPYIEQLSDYIKQYAPTAKQLIHQTWAYETDSTHSAFERYSHSQEIMYNALKCAYDKAAKALQLEIIPCGDVIQTLRSLKEFDHANGGQTLCRDGFHMHLIYGRYTVAAVWYETIFKQSIMQNKFIPHLESDIVDKDKIQHIKRTVHSMCKL